MKIQVVVFRVVTCSDIAGYQRFGVLCCLHLQGNFTLRISWLKMETPWFSEKLISNSMELSFI